MRYVALATPELHIERVMQRAARGGHAASETTLRRIHAASLRNLPFTILPDESGVEFVRVYDNSGFGQSPALALEVERGRIVRLSEDFPVWLQSALGWTPGRLREERDRLRMP
jgi:predicted ABC-type ATPase